jgi:hypothetical protein
VAAFIKTSIRIDTGHTPALSHPRELVDYLERCHRELS